eukprot:14057935-Heterocapsa_arctica.AAC.1
MRRPGRLRRKGSPPQAVDVGRPLDMDESSTEVYHHLVQASTDGGSAHPADHRMRRSGWGIW